MDAREEAERILALYRGDPAQALRLMSDQMTVLQSRAQALMGLAGVVVTVTGFSGRIIAGTNAFAQAAIIVGVVLVLASAIWQFARVLQLRWVTLELDREPVEALAAIIARRDRKTAAYRLGGYVFCLGAAFYLLALSVMLACPTAETLSAR